MKIDSSQRDVKSTRLVNALGRGDCPCILTSAPSQRGVKSTRLVNALGWGDFPCILTSAPSQRDVKSTRLVYALCWGDFSCILTSAPSQRDGYKRNLDCWGLIGLRRFIQNLGTGGERRSKPGSSLSVSTSTFLPLSLGSNPGLRAQAYRHYQDP